MKGLSFSEPMIKAWLAGNKTVTRRLMNPQPMRHRLAGDPYPHHNEGDVVAFANPPSFHKPRYLPGETVYIKETWCPGPVVGAGSEKWCGSAVLYKATDTEISCQWKSPRFMPEAASRSHARIVSVIPERIQEINEVDAYLEGFRDQLRGETFWPVGAQFKEIWDKIHPGSWERNNWVWRIKLEVLK
jgi:hypothetical protein